MNPRSLAQLVITQATMLRRNTGFWLSSIIMAVLSMVVFGWLFNPGTQPFDLAVVDQDGTEASRSLALSFDDIDSVDLRHGSLDKERAALEDGDLGALVIVPEGFSKDLSAGAASLEVLYDNSNPIRIGYVTSTVEAVVDAFNAEVGGETGAVQVDSQAVTTDNVRFIDFLTPGMMGMTIMWVNLGVGFLLVTWREQGILRRLGVTPLRPATLIITQAASFALVSLSQVLAILLVGRFVFDVQVAGSYLWLALTIFLGLAAMLSIGYVLGSALKSSTSVNAVINLVAFPMIFLGGSYFPLDPPAFLEPLVQAIPLTHLNDALRAIVNHADGVSDVWVSWTVLAGWVGAGFLLSLRLFRWQ